MTEVAATGETAPRVACRHRRFRPNSFRTDPDVVGHPECFPSLGKRSCRHEHACRVVATGHRRAAYPGRTRSASLNSACSTSRCDLRPEPSGTGRSERPPPRCRCSRWTGGKSSSGTRRRPQDHRRSRIEPHRSCTRLWPWGHPTSGPPRCRKRSSRCASRSGVPMSSHVPAWTSPLTRPSRAAARSSGASLKMPSLQPANSSAR